jgi:N-acetylglucosaminyldiphosphoundecaprenol N-acetyl-beta-D-mannosaminyltransferase
MDEAVDAIDDMIHDRIPRYVITANLNYAMLLDENAKLKTVTDNASLVLADGQPLVWRSKLRSDGRLPERVAGAELIYRLAERAAVRGSRIYFLGAEPGVAQRCADKLVKLYPRLQVAGVQSPPYRKLTEHEVQKQHQTIIDSRPDILLVAFGQPKGEQWIHENYMKLGVPVSIQLGASFDFIAGTAKRAPKIWQTLGLEWAYRMVSDPGRLVPRYASNAYFLAISLLRDWNEFVNCKFGANDELNDKPLKT